MTALPARAQITTGTVSGTVKDTQGGVIPGATVVLISETKATKSEPQVTNSTGDYVFPNVAADTYTVEVTMSGFKTLARKNVVVSGGDRVTVPNVVLQVGGAAETVNVQAESPMIQANSGERSFAVATEQIENLPINHTNFTSVVSLTPGVVGGGASAGGTRLGGAGQNNIMMDGVSAMDTGNNGQMLNMNVESIAEVKVLTQGYQAEYGRSSGLQITAVTKSGTNKFRGSAYDIQGNSDWNTNSWVNEKNGDTKAGGDREDAGVFDRRSDRQARRQQQAVLLLQPRVSPGDDLHQRRQRHPPAAADRRRARRRLQPVARQQRQPDPAVARSDDAAAVSEQRDPDERVLRARPGDPQPVPDAERHAGAGHQLQLPDRRAVARTS